jgi:hypothetical protein
MRVLVCAVAVVVLAGCNGGTVDRHALTNDAATLDSVACEGALLARDVADGKTTSFFAREQAEELQIQSSNLADALHRRQTVAAIERKVRAKSRQAAVVATWLRRLQDHPSDGQVAAVVGRRLAKFGGCR